MKKIITHLVAFASAGAFLQTGQMTFADDVQIRTGQSSSLPEAKVELRGDQSQSGQFAMGRMRRASELMGAEVHSKGHEKIGSINDLMVDLQGGQVPFVVVSSGGFFGVGDRLMAVPTHSFSSANADGPILLSMDKARLQSAPSFDKNSWPDMSDQTWGTQVYSFYGEQPYWQSGVSTTREVTRIDEPAGLGRSAHSDSKSEIFYGETTTGLSPDRTPRKGLGASDLTKNEEKIRNPGGFAEKDVFIITESAGAERSQARAGTTIESSTRDNWTSTATTSASMPMGKIRRASELIGMEVKNAQGERVGEIKDVVVDLQSGRIAYTVLSAGGYLGMSDRLYAVPPTVFTRATDERTLMFNTDKEMLKAAPSFDKNNWNGASNQKFTTDVYRYYQQQPYWQTGGEIREPAGSQQQNQLNNGRDSSGQWQRENGHDEKPPQIQEPSGTKLPDQSRAQPTDSLQQSSRDAAELKESAGVEPEKNQSPNSQENNEPGQSSAAKETAQLQSQKDANVQEPAGAATSTTPATSEDQAGGTADRELSTRLRTVIKTDSTLSADMENVQVSAANGRITLRGSVASEEQKKALTTKAEEIAGSADKVDNQLQIKPSTPQK